MRTVRFPSIAALVVVAVSTASVRAQPAAGLMTAPEVRALVAGEQASDHAKLRAHFEALSTQYAAAAARHSAFAKAAAANPRERASLAAHCRRLARLFEESSKEARALASKHQEMAAR